MSKGNGQSMKSTKLYLLFILLISSSLSNALSLKAFVDRTQLSQEETLQLTIQADKSIDFSKLDISQLEQQFRVLQQQKSSRFNIINGRSETVVELFLVIAPLAPGDLLIPSFHYQSASTQPIKINVSSNTSQSQSNDQLYVTVETSGDQVYVNSQLLFTWRFYQAVSLNQIEAPELQFENTYTTKIAENRYQTVINGIRYVITERSYAIFPHQSGEFIIPSLEFVASIQDSRDPFGGGLFQRRNNSNIKILRTEEKRINVLPKPKNYTGQHWLPAKNVSINEEWSQDTQDWSVGTPITRTITLEAHDANAAQLPVIAGAPNNDVKSYPEKPTTDEKITDSGLISYRTESTALVPTAEGEFVLPEIKVSWWNTTKNRQEEAVLPARKLMIKANTNAPEISTPAPIINASSGNQPKEPTPTLQLIIQSPLATLFLFLTFISGWIIAFFLWRRLKQQTQEVQHVSNDTKVKQNTVSFRHLQKACSSQDAKIIRQALIEWTNGLVQDKNIINLNDVIQHFNNKELTTLVNSLDSAIYSGQNNQWPQGNQLIDALKTCKQEQSKPEKNTLPPLYPTT